MKQIRKQALSLLFAAAIVAAPVAFLAPAPVQAAEEKKQLDTPLQKHMEEIEKEMKALRKSLKKTDENAASAKSVESIKHHAQECIALIPHMAKDVPEADRAKFTADYKKDMEAFVAEVDKLAAAVKAGKNDEAQEIHKNLKKLEDAGHEKFTK